MLSGDDASHSTTPKTFSDSKSFVILSILIVFISLRLIQNRKLLFKNKNLDQETILKLGEKFSKDFVITALIHTTNLMISGYLTYHQILLI